MPFLLASLAPYKGHMSPLTARALEPAPLAYILPILRPLSVQLQRAAVELAKDWRQDRVLRNLEVGDSSRCTR